MFKYNKRKLEEKQREITTKKKKFIKLTNVVLDIEQSTESYTGDMAFSYLHATLKCSLKTRKIKIKNVQTWLNISL